MRWLTAIFFVLMIMPAQAQSVCANKEQALAAITKQEELVAMGISIDGSVLEVYASPDKKTWTMIAVRPGASLVCFLAIGTNWEMHAPVGGKPINFRGTDG